MPSMTEILEEARFWYSPEPSRELECAISIRAKIASIYEILNAADLEGRRLKVLPFFDPKEMQEVKDALYVVRSLTKMLEDCPEYWDEEYIANREDD